MRSGDEYPGTGEPSRVGAQVGPFTLLCRIGEDALATLYLAEHAMLGTRRVVQLGQLATGAWFIGLDPLAGGAAAPAADIGSRYQLGERLGGGGMAEVFSATMLGAEGFARRVAIKRVLPGLSQIPTFAEMFVAEARIASQLAHPNIVSVLDFARDAEDRLYLVMEYVDGKDLASLLATGPISPGLAIFLMIELLRGLGFVHGVAGAGAHGVVHRDVSPQNLLLSYAGAVKLSDFGLAKVRAASGAVRSDVVRGKPSYMSPEQISGEPLDGRADLFAAGVMLWEMLAGRALFAGTAKEITAQVMFKEVARPSSFRAGVPADLEAVAMTLLAHDRDARYATAEAAIAALLRCADVPRDGRGELVALLTERFAAAQRATPAGPTTVAAPSSAPLAVASSALAMRRPRHRVLAATLGVMTLVGLAAGLVLAQGAHGVGSARGDIAPPRIGELGAMPAITAPAADPTASGPTSGAFPARGVEAAPPRPPRRDRVVRVERTGELAIIVRPWAMIWLNGKPSGQTPFRSAVPVGRYRVRLANDDVGHDEVTTVTVEPDRTATVERSW
jgi:serine/threonine-protein kinase